jgi:hypothetical protein
MVKVMMYMVKLKYYLLQQVIYLKNYFRNGITVGISSRGMGSVQESGNGTVEVQDDFELLCFDFVSTPSTHGAL